MKKNQIEISTRIVFQTILILLAIWFLYLVLDVIALVFIAVILTSAMDPLVDWMQKKKIPRSLGVLGIFLGLFLLFGVVISFVIPPIIKQSQEFSQNFSTYFQAGENSLIHLKEFFEANQIDIDPHQVLGELTGSMNDLSSKIFSKTAGIFSVFVSVIVVLSLAFYMTVEENGINKFIASVTPNHYKKYAVSLSTRIKEKIGKWMLGQFFLMFIIFVLDAIGLYLVGVPYALVLAVFAGVVELVPYIGPIVASIPGIILGFMISPMTGLLAGLVYLVAHQIESHVIVPQVMKKAVGLNPVATIVALLVGFRLGGVMGAVLSIPLATAISLAINDFMERKIE